MHSDDREFPAPPIAEQEGVTDKLTKAAEERGRALLVSFAMLQVRWDKQNSSYIDNFVPFVAHCVKEAGSQAVSTNEIQNQLRERFGLTIPHYALGAVIKRGARQGYFRSENHTLVPNPEKLKLLEIESTYQRAERGYRQLLGKFLVFVRDKYGREFVEGQVDEAFLTYVTDRALPIVRSTLLGKEFQPQLANLGEMELMLAEFIVHLFHEDLEGFDLLDMIVRGCILATALYLPDPNDQGRRVTDLTVYFDTPFLVCLLGLTDPAREEAAKELVQLLRDLGARVACFTHTLRETENLLMASSQSLLTPFTNGHGPNEIVTYALSRGWGRTQLELKAFAVETDLSGIGISIRDAPDYRARTTLDERQMEDVLQNVVGYARPETRVYDVKSLAAIWHLRDGRSQRHLESARAIFVTSNARLVQASAQYFDETPNGLDVPIATLDSHLAVVAWLKRPLAAPDLPRRQVVADCIAALEPGTHLWEAFLNVVEQMHDAGQVTEEGYALLRYGVTSRRALMDETLGDESALTIGSVEEILRRSKDAMSREADHRIEVEARIRQEAEAKAEWESQRATLAEVTLDSERHEHQKELQDSEHRHKEELARRIGNKAHRRARRFARAIYVLLAILVIVGSAASFGIIGGGAVTVVLVICAILSVRHIIFGESLSALASRFERALERKFENVERKSLEI